mmetsp:Transcript_62180/g.200473  ORF Transcript_62180/g.200473 Transcript_62180/m.200473 type:complete len:202 (+) Transcript_62180:76-681(+)
MWVGPSSFSVCSCLRSSCSAEPRQARHGCPGSAGTSRARPQRLGGRVRAASGRWPRRHSRGRASRGSCCQRATLGAGPRPMPAPSAPCRGRRTRPRRAPWSPRGRTSARSSSCRRAASARCWCRGCRPAGYGPAVPSPSTTRGECQSSKPPSALRAANSRGTPSAWRSRARRATTSSPSAATVRLRLAAGTRACRSSTRAK